YPGREHTHPGPVVTPEGCEEFFVDKIVDEQHHGRRFQYYTIPTEGSYLIRWVGEGPEGDLWL
ncbi:hypothetical protein FISHEDRAFT_18264, partial [Fistulina hepatica ATCC 64428]